MAANNIINAVGTMSVCQSCRRKAIAIAALAASRHDSPA